MLGKLMKHEMKAVSRLLFPIYMVLIVFTIAARIVVSLHFEGVFEIIPGAVIGLYTLSIIAIFVVSFVIIIIRFYKNMVTDEGYLMFTLPVKPYQLINSKLIISLFWTILSIIAVLLSIGIVVATPENLVSFRSGFADLMRDIRNELGIANTVLLWFELPLMAFTAAINGILCVYACIAIGQLFSGHKVLGSFVAYIVYIVVMQVLSVVFMIVAGNVFPVYFNQAAAITTVLLPVTILWTIVLSVIFYIVTNYIFNKKLNLE
jgi:hypothetical protein